MMAFGALHAQSRAAQCGLGVPSALEVRVPIRRTWHPQSVPTVRFLSGAGFFNQFGARLLLQEEQE